MPETPTISVVIPVYRAVRYLAAAVESILSQTYGDFELLLVFDRSDDGTEEIIERLAASDARVRAIENTDKKQLSAALNVGLQAARGRYIARMDADDIANSCRFAAQVEFLDRHPAISLCGTAADIIDRNGNVIGHFSPTTGPERVRIAAEYAPPLFHPTWMMRSALPGTLGGYRDMSHAEDYDFLLRALDAGFKLDNLPMTGINYRREPSHRARIVSHKAANYAHSMHRRRMRGVPDGFSSDGFKTAVAPASGRTAERFGQRCIEKSFEMMDRDNPIAPIVMGLGLLLVPASAYLTWRRLKTAMALRVYGMSGRLT